MSLGAWETFGGYRDESVARAVFVRAFELGIVHFDFANNHGDPPGNAELVGGRVLRGLPRDELVISSKAGYRMWPGCTANGARPLADALAPPVMPAPRWPVPL
ncbi:hypothetical protein GCM10027610_129460 [Dactylosporangium cerinum]